MADQPLAPDLLRRLAEHAARIEHIADTSVATVTADIDELDSDGKIAHRLHSVAHVQRIDGHTKTHVISATRDGADDLVNAQKRADDQARKEKPRPSPFATGNSSNYRFAALGPDAVGSKLLRVSLAPVDETHASMDVIVGEALVDPATGECVRLTGKPSKLMMLVEKADVSFEYGNLTPNGRMLSAMTLSYSAGVLFLRKQGNVRMKFDYAPR